MARSKVLIFDFDGTIADSLAMVIDIFRSLVPGHDDASDEQIEALRSLSVKHIAKALDVPIWKVPLLVRRGRKVMHTRVHELQVIPGIPEAVRALHAEGYTMYVASSNSQENIQKFLTDHAIADNFAGIVGSIGLFSKARAIRRLCRQQHIERAHVWYVGDEVRDIVAAREAGVHPVAVGWGFNHPDALQETGPDAYVATPQELVKILEG